MSMLLCIGCSIILSIMFTKLPLITLFTIFSKNNFLEQHVYNNMLFMSLILDWVIFWHVIENLEVF